MEKRRPARAGAAPPRHGGRREAVRRRRHTSFLSDMCFHSAAVAPLRLLLAADDAGIHQLVQRITRIGRGATIAIEWAGLAGEQSTETVLSAAWLRDHCQCPECFDQTTLQRSFDSVELPVDGVVCVGASIADKSVHFDLEIPGFAPHRAEIEFDWLRQRRGLHPNRRRAWNRAEITTDFASVGERTSNLGAVPTTGYARLYNEPVAAGKQLRKHLAEYGIAFVTGVPTE